MFNGCNNTSVAPDMGRLSNSSNEVGSDNLTPCVSIGVPVYNGEHYLEETLQSLISQTFSDFEIIISDNGSSDGTPAICQRFVEKDQRIRYFRSEENRGAAWNFNRVFELSQGKYFRWQAADDKCHPDFLACCVDQLEQNPQAILSYTGAVVINEQDDVLDINDQEFCFDAEDAVMRFSCALDPISYTDVSIFGLIRRDTLEKTQLIGRYLASDRCLMAELSLSGPFSKSSRKLFYRRQHPGNIGTTAEYLEFYDPALKGRVVFPEWRVLGEQIRNIIRSPVGLGTKMRLFALLLRWMCRRRKMLAWQVKDGIIQIHRKCFG